MIPLSREKQAAVQIFVRNRDSIDTLIHTGISRDLLQTNAIAACKEQIQISRLPNDSTWCWNQSSTKFTITLEDDTQVTLRKLCTKVRPSAFPMASPAYKLWVYRISTPNQPNYSFIWCERGWDENNVGNVESIHQHLVIPTSVKVGIRTAIGIIHPESISLQSLSFLRHYTDPITAIELGWDKND